MKHNLQSYIFLSFLMLSCSMTDQDKDVFSVPSNATKSIETRYYEPIQVGTKWVAQSEIDDIHKYHNLAYFDKYDNEILAKDLRDTLTSFQVNTYTATFYDNAELSQKSRIIKARERNLTEQTSKIYGRDSLGRLTSVYMLDDNYNIMFWNLNAPRTIKYNSVGDKTEESEKFVNVSKKVHSDGDITIYSNYSISKTKQYSYNDIYGLDSFETIITDSKSGNVIKSIVESTQFGVMSDRTITMYDYDSNNNIIKEEVYSLHKSMTAAGSIPIEITGNEREELMKKNYIESAYLTEHITKLMSYDSNNNIVKEYCISRENLKLEEFPKEFHDNYYSTKKRSIFSNNKHQIGTLYEYKYNDNNEWIQRITFNIVPEFGKSILDESTSNESVATEICIRTINYL